MYRLQGSEFMHSVQRQGVGNTESIGCKDQEYNIYSIEYVVQGSGVHTIQSIGIRNIYHTGCRGQKCIMHNVQGSEVYIAQSAGVKGG